jgi:hypothetical protein
VFVVLDKKANFESGGVWQKRKKRESRQRPLPPVLSVQQFAGILARCLRKDKEKLVASLASEEIVGCEGGGNDLNDLLESDVAGRVASGVADLFEMIDVDERDGELVAVSFGRRVRVRGVGRCRAG